MSDTEKEIIESHEEIGEVTITEYRKNQMVRLTEMFVVAPACMVIAIKYRKQLPAWASLGLGAIGVATLFHSGISFFKNHQRDGKLIRTAIKQKRMDESRVREEKKKEGVAGELKSAIAEVKKHVPVQEKPQTQQTSPQQTQAPVQPQKTQQSAPEQKQQSAFPQKSTSVEEKKTTIPVENKKITINKTFPQKDTNPKVSKSKKIVNKKTKQKSGKKK